MSDPIDSPAACYRGLGVALYIADARAKVRKTRQRVACLPLDDPRRTLDLARFIVTDAEPAS